MNELPVKGLDESIRATTKLLLPKTIVLIDFSERMVPAMAIHTAFSRSLRSGNAAANLQDVIRAARKEIRELDDSILPLADRVLHAGWCP